MKRPCRCAKTGAHFQSLHCNDVAYAASEERQIRRILARKESPLGIFLGTHLPNFSGKFWRGRDRF